MKRPLLIIAGIVLFYLFILSLAFERPDDQERFSIEFPVPADADTSTCEPGAAGGRVIIGTTGDPKTFNPIVSTDRTSNDVIERMFSSLVSKNRITGEIEPRLAYAWEFSEDNSELTFHMRRDVKWSDGVPVTAYDVEFTYEAIYHPDIVTMASDVMQVNGEPFVGTAIDSFTFHVKAPSPVAPFPKIAGGDDMLVVPKHILKPYLDNGTFDSAYNISWPPEKFVSCGPYLLEKFKSGTKTVLRRNPNYWRIDRNGTRLPYLERIIFVTTRSFETNFLQFISGDLDMLNQNQVKLSDVPILERDAEKGNYLVENIGPRLSLLLIWFNMKTGVDAEGNPYIPPHKLKWFSDVRWRKAISYAIDRQNMIDRVAEGLCVPQYGPESPGNKEWYNPNIVSYEFDLDKSRELLDSMELIDRDGDGLREDEDGNSCEFTLITYTGASDLIGTIIKDDLAKIGIKMNYNQVEFKTLLVKIHNEFTYDCSMIGLSPGDTDPSDGLNVWLSNAGMHMWNPNQETPATDWEARIDELMNLQMTELDYTKRKVYYDEVQYIISDQAPFIYMYTPQGFVAYSQELRNIVPSVINHSLLWNIEEAWRE